MMVRRYLFVIALMGQGTCAAHDPAVHPYTYAESKPPPKTPNSIKVPNDKSGYTESKPSLKTPEPTKVPNEKNSHADKDSTDVKTINFHINNRYSHEVVSDAAMDSNGQVVVTGTYLFDPHDKGTNSSDPYYEGTESLDPRDENKRDVFLTKIDPDSGVEWIRQFGTPTKDESLGVACDLNNNIYVVGYTGGRLGKASSGKYDAFLIKYAPTGDRLWVRQFGTLGSDQAVDVATDRSGHIYIIGVENLTLAPRIPKRFFVIKYNPSGAVLWKHFWKGQRRESVKAMTVGPGGSLFITGQVASSPKRRNFSNLDNENRQRVNAAHVYLVKMSASGRKLWRKKDRSTADMYVVDLITDGGEYLYLAGTKLVQTVHAPYGTHKGFLSKYDRQGKNRWTKIWRYRDTTVHGVMYWDGIVFVAGGFSKSRFVFAYSHHGDLLREMQIMPGVPRAVVSDASGRSFIIESGYGVSVKPINPEILRRLALRVQAKNKELSTPDLRRAAIEHDVRKKLEWGVYYCYKEFRVKETIQIKLMLTAKTGLTDDIYVFGPPEQGPFARCVRRQILNRKNFLSHSGKDLQITLSFAAPELPERTSQKNQTHLNVRRATPEDFRCCYDRAILPIPFARPKKTCIPTASDQDRDCVSDVNDQCPNEKEDLDYWEDDDGCADKDNDKDRIEDIIDCCPFDPETYNGIDDSDGCPESSHPSEAPRPEYVWFSDGSAIIGVVQANRLSQIVADRICQKARKQFQITAYYFGGEEQRKLAQTRADSVEKFLKQHRMPYERFTIRLAELDRWDRRNENAVWVEAVDNH